MFVWVAAGGARALRGAEVYVCFVKLLCELGVLEYRKIACTAKNYSPISATVTTLGSTS